MFQKQIESRIFCYLGCPQMWIAVLGPPSEEHLERSDLAQSQQCGRRTSPDTPTWSSGHLHYPRYRRTSTRGVEQPCDSCEQEMAREVCQRQMNTHRQLDNQALQGN